MTTVIPTALNAAASKSTDCEDATGHFHPTLQHDRQDYQQQLCHPRPKNHQRARPVVESTPNPPPSFSSSSSSTSKRRNQSNSSSSSQSSSSSTISSRIPFHILWTTLFCMLQLVWIWPSVQNTTNTLDLSTSRSSISDAQEQHRRRHHHHHRSRRGRREQQRRQEIEQKLSSWSSSSRISSLSEHGHSPNHAKDLSLVNGDDAEVVEEGDDDDDDDDRWIDEAVTPVLEHPIRATKKFRVRRHESTEKTKDRTKHKTAKPHADHHQKDTVGNIQRHSARGQQQNVKDDVLTEAHDAQRSGGDSMNNDTTLKIQKLKQKPKHPKYKAQQEKQQRPPQKRVKHSSVPLNIGNNNDYYLTSKEEDEMKQRFDGYFKDPNGTVADWDYYPKLPQRVQEPPSLRSDDDEDDTTVLLSQKQRQLLNFDPSNQEQCLEFLKVVDTSPPPLPAEPSHTACDGYDGVFHIRHYDGGAASGTAFFQLTIGMLQWADQHNYLPWIHIDDDVTKPIWDNVVHTQARPRVLKKANTTNMSLDGSNNSTVSSTENNQSGSSSHISFTMQSGVEVGWAIDKRDSWFCVFPGKPELGHKFGANGRRRSVSEESEIIDAHLEPKEFVVSGTGVWDHYFMPPVKNGFIPGDKSCTNKPLVRFDVDHIAPGMHANAPWAPRAWRTAEAPYIVQRRASWDDWFSDQRRHASEIVQRYIRFNPYMVRRAQCAFPDPEFSLGLHIRHGDKYLERDVIKVGTFYRYAKAFVQNGGGAIYVATDSARVFDVIDKKWPKKISSHVVRQPAMMGLTRNKTAAFDLGLSAHRTNVEALTDLLALSKCTFFLHGLSALSEAVLYINPTLWNRSINLEIEDHDYMTPQFFVEKMMPMVASPSKKDRN